MNQSVEIELKAMLTKDEFERLLRYFEQENTCPIVQRNTYYDTPNQILKMHRVALRLRNFADRSEWTIKQAQSDVASLELNQMQHFAYQTVPDVPDIREQTLIDFLQKHQIELNQLRPTLTLQTERWIIQCDCGEFCLDRTTYFNITDYEIELETTQLEQAQAAFQTLLAQHQIPYRHADKKIARAFKSQL